MAAVFLFILIKTTPSSFTKLVPVITGAVVTEAVITGAVVTGTVLIGAVTADDESHNDLLILKSSVRACDNEKSELAISLNLLTDKRPLASAIDNSSDFC